MAPRISPCCVNVRLLPLSSQRAVVAASSTKSSFSALWLAGYAHTALVGSRLAPHFYHHPALPPGP